MNEFKLTCGRGNFRIYIQGRLIGEDLIISVFGGNRPHIGTVAIALPRQSLKDPERTSATSSIFTLLGHKEDLLAKAFSERLASELNRVVVVTAGIHQDKINEEGITKFLNNCEKACAQILKLMKKIK